MVESRRRPFTAVGVLKLVLELFPFCPGNWGFLAINPIDHLGVRYVTLPFSLFGLGKIVSVIIREEVVDHVWGGLSESRVFLISDFLAISVEIEMAVVMNSLVLHEGNFCGEVDVCND